MFTFIAIGRSLDGFQLSTQPISYSYSWLIHTSYICSMILSYFEHNYLKVLLLYETLKLHSPWANIHAWSYLMLFDHTHFLNNLLLLNIYVVVVLSHVQLPHLYNEAGKYFIHNLFCFFNKHYFFTNILYLHLYIWKFFH